MPFVIPTFFTAIDQLSSPVHRMQGALVGMTTAATAGELQLQRSLQATSAAALEVATSAGMLAGAILIPLGLATKAAIDFEKQMGNVATLVDTTKESIGSMGDELLGIASRMPIPIQDLTESLYQIRSAGVGAADAMHVLEVSGRLSVAGLSTATEATKGVTSALVAFKAQGLTADQIANSFFLTVKEGKTKMDALNESFGNNAAFIASAGVKLQDFNALTAALTISGLSASEAQNGISASVVGLIKPTTEMTKIYRLLGVASGEALIKKTGNVGDAIMDVTKAAKGANIEIPKLFNRMALKTVSTIVGGAFEPYKNNIKEQTAGVDALTTAYEKQLGTTASQAQIAKNNLATLGIRIGELLLPALTGLLKAVTPIINGLSDFAHNHKTLAGIIVGSIAAFGVFAAVVAGLAITVYTVTKAFWLWNLAGKVLAFTQGILAVATGTLNGELLLTPAAAKGAALGMRILNAGALGVLATFTKLAALTLLIYGIWKLFEKRDEQGERMAAILPHLPAGVDKKKFSDQFQDALSPGFVPLAKRMQGVQSYYPQSLYDSLAKKYYDDPKAQEDSLSKVPISELIKGSQNASDTTAQDHTVSYNTVDKNGNITITIDNKSGNKVYADAGNSGIPVYLRATGVFTKTGMA
jgi:TP901 family phage tail tape measure protein